MTRIPYRETSKLSDLIRDKLGDRPANVTRMLAGASEGVYVGFGAFGNALINESSLPPKLRELAILRVGYISGSEYETYQHEALGRHVGLSEDQLAAIKAGDANSTALGDAETAVMKFVEDLVHNVRAGDETLAAVRIYLDDTQLIDLILVSGAYMMVSRLLETTGVELDANPIDWSNFSPTG